jgi:hypothetical protein
MNRRRQGAHSEILTLIATGRRREALAAAERLAHTVPPDSTASEHVERLRARRLVGPVLRLALLGKPYTVVLGDEVVLGRTEGALTLRSSATSRKHLAIARSDGRIIVRDLASRNGTLLRGMRIADAVPVGEGLELQLGGEVTLGVAPSAVLDGAVDIRVAGERYVAPLGMARLGIGDWRLECAADGWIELVSTGHSSAFLGSFALAPRTTLLAGDAITATRSGETALEILGMG